MPEQVHYAQRVGFWSTATRSLDKRVWEAWPARETHTSLDERVPELLGKDAAAVLDVDVPEDAVELELLVVHVAPEVVVADASVAVAVAGAEQLPRVLALGGHLQRRQAGLDLRVVEVPAPRGVEEGEHVADPRLPLVLRLMQREKHVLHGDGSRLPHRLAAPARTRRGCGHGGWGGGGRGGTAPGVHRVCHSAGHGADAGGRR
jgi:hypothetical protein